MVAVMRMRCDDYIPNDDDYSNDKDTWWGEIRPCLTDHAIRSLGVLNKRVTVGGGGDVWTMQTLGRYLWRRGGGGGGGGGGKGKEKKKSRSKEHQQCCQMEAPKGTHDMTMETKITPCPRSLNSTPCPRGMTPRPDLPNWQETGRKPHPHPPNSETQKSEIRFPQQASKHDL
ncbi:hypothetical protein E2C01_009146 [Portunus trituberculatus]|uniref:Uncharacterized protein n=1 Tax=Portunus trituberculatus TaxID=210409 RepID=A0A5B7D582_PORTR|nr:hypothetical protein [Portunus trituberculatus]